MKNVYSLLLILCGLVLSPTSLASHVDMTRQGIQERIQPVGKISIEKAATNAEKALPKTMEQKAIKVDGQQVYTTSCKLCHDSGAAGAPKLGDKQAWQARLAKGTKTLIQHAIKGINAMPAKGGCIKCTDEQIAAAVQYMLKQSK